VKDIHGILLYHIESLASIILCVRAKMREIVVDLTEDNACGII